MSTADAAAATQEDVVQAVYRFAAEHMANGDSNETIQQKLVDEGLEADHAQTVVTQLREARRESLQAAAKKNMAYGALWCIGGLVVTLASYNIASSNPEGGRYVMAWGAVVFGAIQFFRGVGQLNQT